jgi:hypothetical protein
MTFIDRISEDGVIDSGLSGPDLWALVISRGMCSRSGLDPDQWYPVSGTAQAARREAVAALAACSGCVVRRHCLELSLRYWEVGQHGVWGGTVPAERAELRNRLSERRLSRIGASQLGDRAVS